MTHTSSHVKVVTSNTLQHIHTSVEYFNLEWRKGKRERWKEGEREREKVEERVFPKEPLSKREKAVG